MLERFLEDSFRNGYERLLHTDTTSQTLDCNQLPGHTSLIPYCHRPQNAGIECCFLARIVGFLQDTAQDKGIYEKAKQRRATS